MAQGLQVWDENGTILLDTNDRIAKFMGSVTVSSSGSLTVPSISGNEVFAFYNDPKLRGCCPTITVSGNVVTWTYNASYAAYGNVTVTIIYGRF